MAQRICEKCAVPIPNEYINSLCNDCYGKVEEANKAPGKKCEVCGKDIPDNFVNLLCWDCYDKEAERNEKKQQEEIDRQKEKEEPKPELFEDTSTTKEYNAPNPQNISADYDWLARVVKRFNEIGILIPENQRRLYEQICDEVAGRTVVDIGCSLGIGSNILANSARHVWGIDINKKAIEFASQAFERPNTEFAIFDIERPPTRPLASFEVVVCIEVLEHLVDVQTGIGTIKGFFSDRLSTIGFITAPNIENEDIRIRDEDNKLHIHRWTRAEFTQLMQNNFNNVNLISSHADPLLVARVGGLR